MEKVNKDQAILEMLEAGKSYTDIMAELNVSPVRIIVLKKKLALKSDDSTLSGTKNLAELKEKIKIKAKELEKLDKPEKEYFESLWKLNTRIKQLAGGKYGAISFGRYTHQNERNNTREIRIKLERYLIERISRSEYTLKNVGNLND